MHEELYKVECASDLLEGDGGRVVAFFCMARWRGGAIEQAEQDEDPELGGYIYGEPETGETCTFAEMDAIVRSSMEFPEGDWAATEEARDALEQWRKVQSASADTLF